MHEIESDGNNNYSVTSEFIVFNLKNVVGMKKVKVS